MHKESKVKTQHEKESQCSSVNDSDESSDNEVGNSGSNNCINADSFQSENPANIVGTSRTTFNDKVEASNGFYSGLTAKTQPEEKEHQSQSSSSSSKAINYSPDLKNLPKNVLLQLIEGGHLEVHNEEDGSGHQYVAIPLSSSSVGGMQSRLPNDKDLLAKQSLARTHLMMQKDSLPELNIKEEP